MSIVVRPLEQVIDAALKLIPTDFERRAAIETELEKIKSDYDIQPPEALGSLWRRFAHCLVINLGDPDTQWKNDVADLMQGKKDYLEVLNA